MTTTHLSSDITPNSAIKNLLHLIKALSLWCQWKIIKTAYYICVLTLTSFLHLVNIYLVGTIISLICRSTTSRFLRKIPLNSNKWQTHWKSNSTSLKHTRYFVSFMLTNSYVFSEFISGYWAQQSEQWRLTIIFLSHCFLELFELFICVSFLKLLFYMIIGYAYSHRVEGVSISSALFLTLSTCCLIVHKLLQGCLRFDVFLKRTCMLSLRWVVVIPAQKTLFTKSGTHRHHYSFE